MDRDFYFSALYPFQDEVLRVLAGLDIGLYLTGGTAASRGYLHHRFSDDLDLFANDDAQFGLWTDRVIQGLARLENGAVNVLQRDLRFVRLNVVRGDVILKVEMVNDVPSRVGQISMHPVLGRLDSPENILANKISALLDREEPKDLADIWGFGCQLGLSVAEALEGAQGKAAGIFPVDVARLLCTVERQDWALVRWIDPPDPDTFLADLRRLGEGLILPG